MKRLISLLILLFSCSILSAQYTFTISSSYSGNCSEWIGGKELTIAVGVNDAYLKATNEHIQQNPFSTKSECESARASMMGSQNLDGCIINTFATPCVGFGGDDSGGSGLAAINGPQTGGSFYSVNPANEIRDWAEDNAALLDIIGGVGNANGTVAVSTGNDAFDELLASDLNNLNASPSGRVGPVFDDGFFTNRTFNSLGDAHSDDFRWRNVDMVNVQNYLSAVDHSREPSVEPSSSYISWVYRQFKTITGIDMAALQNKAPDSMTNEEKQAILDFEAFATKLINDKKADFDDELRAIDLTPEKHEVDMAVLAIAPYGNAEEYLQYTNYRMVTPESFTPGDPMRGIAETIQLLNSTDDDTGWHAELYFNSLTGKYTIACAGTDDKLDAINDGALAFGLETPQYTMANALASAINSIPQDVRGNLDIEIVGHSLGGGVASIIGLSTGLPTYTYNAAGVSNSTLSEMGLLEKKQAGDYDITAYHTANDIVTGLQTLTMQDYIGASAVGNPVNIGIVSDVSTQVGAAITGAVVGAVVFGPGGAVDGALAGWQVQGHFMAPIVDHFVQSGGAGAQRCHSINVVKNQYDSALIDINGKALSAHDYTQF